MKYLILKAWSDNMENECSNAFGYEPFGYTDTKEEAETYTKEMVPPNFSWVLGYGDKHRPTPMFKFEEIQKLPPI